MKKSSYLLIDLRSYTKFILTRPHRKSSTLINQYYKIVDRFASKNRGFFCSTLGDTIGIVFDKNNHADMAVQTAFDILKELKKIKFAMKATAGIDSGEISVFSLRINRSKLFFPIGSPIVKAYFIEDISISKKFDIVISRSTYTALSRQNKKLFKLLGQFKLQKMRKNVCLWGVSV